MRKREKKKGWGRKGARKEKERKRKELNSEEGERELNLICQLHIYLTHHNALVLGPLRSKIQ